VLVTITPFGVDMLTMDVATIMQWSLFAGMSLAVVVALIMFARGRDRLRREIERSKYHVAQLGDRLSTQDIFFSLTGQCLIVWDEANTKPWDKAWIVGNLPQGNPIPQQPSEFLDFNSWLPSGAAAEFFALLATLEREATPFDTTINVGDDVSLHFSGYLCGSRLMLHIQPAAKLEIDFSHANARVHALEDRLVIMQNLLDEVKDPIWLREEGGAIIWGNRAYFRASGSDHELLSPMQCDKIAATHAKGEIYAGKVGVIVDGDRHEFEVTSVAGSAGSAAIALDLTQKQALQQTLQRNIHSYMEIFDQLSTGVVIFDEQMHLNFYNQSFASLWPLDIAFLESRPSHALLLDRLREQQIIPETPNWREWKETLFTAYRAVAWQQRIWSLADGRTLRVLAHPAPQGGVIWLYEDLSEKLALQTRFNSLIQMQGETLDHLREGVAVFGADGQMRLANPAFATMWMLPAGLAIEGCHISRIEECCSALMPEGDWHHIAAIVTGFAEMREGISGRMELYSGTVLDYALVPLPQGQSMLTFVDVSDSVRVADALRERNEALESADRLRNDFVSHVSYQLRTPLTNIIGFTDLLRTPAFGPLNERQRDYLQHISTQSSQVLHIVNDILDLATVEAGIMELDIGEVRIAEAMNNAVARVEERLKEKHLQLEIHIAPGLESFQADGARIHQILFNILSNAASFAPEGSTIHFSARTQEGEIIFQVHDAGAGIPEPVLSSVFKPFAAHAHHGIRSGAGLGLAIVKNFVELHHGSVDIDTSEDRGTTLTCRFPKNAALTRAAAE